MSNNKLAGGGSDGDNRVLEGAKIQAVFDELNLDLKTLAEIVRSSMLTYDSSTYERVREKFTDKEIATAALSYFGAAVSRAVGARNRNENDEDDDLVMILSLCGYFVLDGRETSMAKEGA